MRFKITWLMMSFAIICGYHALAQQQLKVRGSVYDNNGRPMQLVTISMISAPDSILIKTDLSDEKGEFEIITRSKGVFILSYSSIGFETFYTPPVNTSTDTPGLFCNNSSALLPEALMLFWILKTMRSGFTWSNCFFDVTVISCKSFAAIFNMTGFTVIGVSGKISNGGV